MHIRNPLTWVFAQVQAKDAIGSAEPGAYWPVARAWRAPEVRKVGTAELREALRLGWQDFGAARTDLIVLWVVYAVVCAFVAVTDRWGNTVPLLFPTASGFALLGPFMAVGFYEMSRQRELRGETKWRDALGVVRSPSIAGITGLGLLLIVLFLAWLGVALGIYDATLGPKPPANVLAFLDAVFTTGAGWGMIVLGVVVGAVFAVAVLAISAVSFPLMLDRPASLRQAVETSWRAVRVNPVPMALWGLLVAVALVLGAVPIFIGLIVVLPVLGHATWHLYRKIIK